MFPIWIYLTVAVLIAATAFGIGQLAPGFGVGFMAAASGLWIGYSVHRAKRHRGRC